MNANQLEALRVFSAYTAGRFDPWMLAGSAKASSRAHIMSAFNGRRTPQSQSGVTAIREAFHTLAFDCDAPNFRTAECLATREDAFQEWARTITKTERE